VCGEYFYRPLFSFFADTAECKGCRHKFAFSDLVRTDFPSGPPVPPLGVSVSERGKDWVVVAAHRSSYALIYWVFAVPWLAGALSVFRAPSSTKYTGTPLLIAGLIIVWLAVLQTWGSLTLCGRDNRASVFGGVGRLGRLRPFDLNHLSEIHLSGAVRPKLNIELWFTGDFDIRFGMFLSTDQLSFMAAYLFYKTKTANTAI